MKSDKSRLFWKRVLDFAPLLLLIVLTVVFAAIDPRIVNGTNLKQILVQAAPISILALGALVVLVSGGIDLSVGFGIGLAAIVVGVSLSNGGALFEAIAWALIVGLAVGIFNGFFIGYLKIPPFIVTLGAMIIIQGITLLVARGHVLVISDKAIKSIGIGTTGGVPNILIVAATLIVLIAVLIKQTRFGLRTYALGSSEESTQVTGVPIHRQQLLIYAFSAICTAVAAIMMVSRVSIVTPNLGGNSYMLDAITATVIGGTSIFGGKGSISGTLIGALIISLMTHSLTMFGVSATSLDFFKGAIIILALIADSGVRAAKGRLELGLRRPA
ncbi:ABC transporter permease [Cohnella hongkongensis]|uniref:ABC transporter permease n=1 Tax=Cohnella hongkongensis TaxID=178337 RepID=A0ABV9F919_9BACL